MSKNLTPDQQEVVEENLTEKFVSEQDNVAATLGLQRQPNGQWSDEDADRIVAEIDRIWRPRFVNAF
jgi:hypothetical protein